MSAFVTGFLRRNKQEWHITTLARIVEAIFTPERPASAGHDSSSRQEGQKMSEADLKQEAEQRLGTEIESSEWDKAKNYAERKLKGIIERFGDEGGIRREPWYLAQLIAETVQQNRFSRFTIELMELNRYADMEIKKGQPVS